MVARDGKVYVMDFGLARQLSGPSTLTKSGFVLGTPMYMSPEQAQALPDRNEKLCDVYGLGATLYDLLTGRPPFDGEEPWDMLSAWVLVKDPASTASESPHGQSRCRC